MKKALVTILALSAASVYADTNGFDGFYLGGGVATVGNTWDDRHWSPAEVFGGYKLNPLVGGEIRMGTSSGAESKITNYESVYYRIESSNSVGKSYLLAGYTHAELDAERGSFTFNGFSYGAGVGFVIGDQFNLNLEYKVLADAKGSVVQTNNTTVDDLKIKLSSISATVDYRF